MSNAVATAAAQAYQEVGYLFVVEGWPIMFTNRVELAGAGSDSTSWIYAEDGSRTVALGLEPPARVKLAVGVVESGMPIDDGLSLTIVDRDGYLIDLMTDDDGSLLVERVDPTDPAPATATGSDGTAVTVQGAWINGEAINGDSGARRQYGILPGVTLPGYDHPATDAAEATLRTSKVRTEARWLEGLPCALYLIRKDLRTGTWPVWTTQYGSGYSLIWWGTLRGVTAESKAWTLQCDGPSSWLRRTLNVTMPTEWRSIDPYLAFDTGEDRIAVAFSYRAPKDDSEAGEVSAYTASDVITSGQTPAELAAEIDARLQDLVNNAGVDINFETAQNGAVKLHDEGFSIRIDDNTAGANGYALAGVMQLRMHWKAWLHLGWDLKSQSKDKGLNIWAPMNSEYEVAADTSGDTFFPVTGDPPTADYGGVGGYWEAVFTTVPLKTDAIANFDQIDGGGAWRTYKPVNGENGSVTVLHPGAQQLVAVGWDDARYNTGQLHCPPADVTVAGGAADRAGFIVVRGPYRKTLDDESPGEIWQLARVSWRNAATGEAIRSDSAGRAMMWFGEWLDPRLWGGADAKLSAPWACGNDDEEENRVRWAPIALLGYNSGWGDKADRADLVLLRLLLSSGTAAWTGVGADATIADGVNDDASASGYEGVGNDREIADLGLCIPAAMVDWDSFVEAADALPGGKSGPLNRTRLAYVGPFDSQSCIESILQPRGWCFSLDGGQYGMFARNVPLDLDDVQVALTQATVAADPDHVGPAEQVDMRPLEPIDLIEVTFGQTQLGGGEGRDSVLQIKARDPRAQARRGNAKVEIDGRSLLAPRPSDVPAEVCPSWAAEFGQLWGDQLARFYGEPHAMVTVSIKGDTARDLWPGTIVSYTSDWPATRTGAYGMSARVGRVVSTELDTLTLAKTCEILVEGYDPTSRRRFGPIARLVDTHTTREGRHNAATYTVTCQADAFGRGDGTSDVAAFVEPSWSTRQGDLTAYVWQSWDGLTWEQTASFVVSSVDTTANTITYGSGAGLTGTIWENRYGIIVGATGDNQPGGEWPDYVFGVVCGTDEKYGGGNATGYAWLE